MSQVKNPHPVVYLKKLVAVVTDNPDYKKIAMETASDVKPITLETAVIQHLSEAIRWDFNKELVAPIRIGEHQLRHFMGKLDRGIKAIQNYIGKVVNTREEAKEFFFNHVGTRAYGKNWLLEELSKFITNEKEGVFLITDLAMEQASILRSLLGPTLVVVQADGDPQQMAKVLDGIQPVSIKRLTKPAQTNKNKPKPKEKVNE